MKNSLWSVCALVSARSSPWKELVLHLIAQRQQMKSSVFVCAICSTLINARGMGLLSWFSGSAPKFNTSLKRHDCQSWVIWPGVTTRVERNGPLHYIMVLENISRWPQSLCVCQSDWSRWPWALFKAWLQRTQRVDDSQWLVGHTKNHIFFCYVFFPMWSFMEAHYIRWINIFFKALYLIITIKVLVITRKYLTIMS